MTADFASKTALIAGAGHGIGRALALGPAERVHTAMQARIRLMPGQSTIALVAHLSGDDIGAIWDFSTAPARS